MSILVTMCLLGSVTIKAQEINQDVIEPVMKESTTTLKIGSKEAILSGQVVPLLVEPTIIKDRTFLPLRFVTEQILEAEVSWDNQLKKAVVKKDGTIVEVVLNHPIALVNGQEVRLDAPPVIMNDSILLPIRFMSETFGMTVTYNSKDKTIIIKSMKENKVPIAAFYLDKNNMIQGQDIIITDKSHDQDYDGIITRVWTLNDKVYATQEQIREQLLKAKPGKYKITLKVQDYCGSWSERVEEEINIEANQAPVITKFEPHKISYAQGETIDFTYAFENESWEEIQGMRWTYRYEKEPTYNAVITKPTALFAKGEYKVTLQLTDAYGNVSTVKETTLHITDEVKETELSYKFKQGKPGDTIDNIQGINYRDYKDVQIESMFTNTETLIMSDSPEEVNEKGILYTSSFQGKGRLLLHHLSKFDPSESPDKMLVVVAENTSYEPVTMTLSNKVVKGPGADVMYLGQQLLRDYLNGGKKEIITFAPGQRVYLYTSGNKHWAKGQCISGLMNLHTTGEIQLTTAVIDKKDTIYEVGRLEPLERSIHVRGTFEGTVINYEVVTDTEKASKLVIGDRAEEWVSGTDQITEETMKNKGNYGVTYKIKITATEDTGIILNPRADIFRGAVKWAGEEALLAPSYGYFMNTSKKAVVLGVLKAGETKTLEYMLPNGSSAPVLIGFMPCTMW